MTSARPFDLRTGSSMAVTVRAEMSRLRKVIGPEFGASRPYRLLAPITSDVGAVFDTIEAGDVESALVQYSGPLLRQSVSPAIARLRTELSSSLRGAVLATGRLARFDVGSTCPKGATTATAGVCCTTLPRRAR